MLARDFCYWLQGYFELNDVPLQTGVQRHDGISVMQAECIKRHLALVFKHEIDPSAGDAVHQAELNEIHNKPKTDEEMAIRKAVRYNNDVIRC
jgi:hypothetical protein